MTPADDPLLIVPVDPPHAARLDASDRRVAWIAGLIEAAVLVAVVVMMSR
jgi:hypothetical protein